MGKRNYEQYPWPPTLVFYCLFGLLLFYPTAGAEDAPGRPDLSGLWELDEERSENPRDKLREISGRGGPAAHPGRSGGGLGGRGGRASAGDGGAPGGRGRPQRLRAMMSASLALEIEHRESTLRVKNGDEEGEQVFLTDGGEFERRFGDGEPMPATARWSGEKLIVETETPAGGAWRETYELTEEGRLQITVETPGNGRWPGIEFRRVYERPAEES